MRRKKFLIATVILGVIALPVLFFILSTKTASPTPITIITPKSETTRVIGPHSKNTVSLLLLSKDEIYSYKGSNDKAGRIYDYANIRNYLIDIKKNSGDSLDVVIKKSKYASYKNTVDILDEMTINNIKNLRWLMLQMKN